MKPSSEEHVILWDFVVRPGSEADFEAAYSSKGAWASLFALSSEFLGTELLRSTTNPRRYMTVDRWASAEAFRRFHSAHDAEYLTLDAKCNQLTESEDPVGAWTSAET